MVARAAVGCGAVWELWSCRGAHEGLHPAQICVGVCDSAAQLRPAWDEEAPAPLRALARDCWAADPAARLAASPHLPARSQAYAQYHGP